MQKKIPRREKKIDWRHIPENKINFFLFFHSSITTEYIKKKDGALDILFDYAALRG